MPATDTCPSPAELTELLSGPHSADDLERVARHPAACDRCADAAARDRFLREARAAAALTHDHIVTIYQVGEASGAPFLAMQLLQGESLDDYLARGKKLSAGHVCRIGRETALGLAAAHAKGLI